MLWKFSEELRDSTKRFIFQGGSTYARALADELDELQRGRVNDFVSILSHLDKMVKAQSAATERLQNLSVPVEKNVTPAMVRWARMSNHERARCIAIYDEWHDILDKELARRQWWEEDYVVSKLPEHPCK